MKIIANGVDRGLTGRKVRQGLYKIQTRVEKLSYEFDIRCCDSMEIKDRTIYQESKIDTPFAL